MNINEIHGNNEIREITRILVFQNIINSLNFVQLNIEEIRNNILPPIGQLELLIVGAAPVDKTRVFISLTQTEPFIYTVTIVIRTDSSLIVKNVIIEDLLEAEKKQEKPYHEIHKFITMTDLYNESPVIQNTELSSILR
jgi:hypothetical protein